MKVYYGIPFKLLKELQRAREMRLEAEYNEKNKIMEEEERNAARNMILQK